MTTEIVSVKALMGTLLAEYEAACPAGCTKAPEAARSDDSAVEAGRVNGLSVNNAPART